MELCLNFGPRWNSPAVHLGLSLLGPGGGGQGLQGFATQEEKLVWQPKVTVPCSSEGGGEGASPGLSG